MGGLRVRKVVYSGQKYIFESEIFDKNIILVEGDNGTGKSTLCNLIYFGLGGRVAEFKKDNDIRHKEITSDTDNFVELYIKIKGEGYLLRRYLTENDVTVVPYVERIAKTDDDEEGDLYFDAESKTEETKVFAINRREDKPFTFSDWMLEKLNINVVEIYQGYKTFKINFTDLMRLVYHDQQPDPEFIYKKLDKKSNYVSDSETLRKAIFELLVGRSFSDLYQAIVEEKRADREKLLAKTLVDEYASLAEKLRGREDLKNKSFLQSEIQKIEEQLEKLQAAREAFKKNRSSTSSVDPQLGDLKNSILKSELKHGELRDKLVNLYDERYKLTTVRKDTVREVGQIQKVIHTHNQLNLLSSDTCPYCLSKVDRIAGHCVCGASIEEEQYERFFYTSQEYNEILKSKTKTLTTIELAITGCNEEIDSTKFSLEDLETGFEELREKRKKILEQADHAIDLETINDIDDKVLDAREDLSKLYQRLETESKLEKLQGDYDKKREFAADCELKRKELEVKSRKDITNKVKKISEIYNTYITETLPESRTARIRLEDYMPSIDEGEYKEASSRVSVRLMYYLSLLKLSLVENDTSFPKFLLVDTPETAGIEMGNLINCMQKIESLDGEEGDYQVILATGLDKYPESLKDNRVLYMPTKKEALLKERV